MGRPVPVRAEDTVARRVELRLLRDRAHYDALITRGIAAARVSVWVATANLKELHVEAPIGSRARARASWSDIARPCAAALPVRQDTAAHTARVLVPIRMRTPVADVRRRQTYEKLFRRWLRAEKPGHVQHVER